MGKIWMPGGGGGGAKSDETNVTKEYVLAGRTYIGSDTDDEVGTGTMPDKAGTTQSASGSVDSANKRVQLTIPSLGRYSTTSKVYIAYSTLASLIGLTAAKLAKNQTVLGIAGSYTSDATASAPRIQSGYTAYINGSKVIGTLTISSLVSFSVAAYSTSQVVCTWKYPSKGPYSGVAICGKTGSYPSSKDDSRLYTGYGSTYALGSTSSVTIGGLSAGQTYYFRIWLYCTVNTGNWHSNYLQATCKVASHGSQTFTASGTWTCPAGVRTITRAFLVGGGGGGGTGQGSGYSYPHYAGAGGAGGYTTTVTNKAVTPGQKYAVVVGAGGNGGTNGGQSSIAGIASANGGKGGGHAQGVNGGSGSGAGAEEYSNGGNGGSDGGNGQTVEGVNGGTGQGRTTRKFGESGNTLYSGGGAGGGAAPDDGWRNGGSGGAGGGASGGRGNGTDQDAGGGGANAGNNTGGGGGGGGASRKGSGGSGGKGGSGIVIIEW